MTITKFTGRWDFVGDGVTTGFDFDNLVVKETDLDVYLDGVLKVIVTHYTVTGAGTDAGSVEFLVAPAVDVAVAMIRKTDLNQLTEYPTDGPFPAASHVGTVDKLTIIVQELEGELSRSLKFQDSSLAVNVLLEDPVGDAILTFASDGLSIINGPSFQEILDSETAAVAAAATAVAAAIEAVASAAAALVSEGNAAASESAAAASEAAAAISAAAAAVSAAAALVSEINAAASAARLQGTSATPVAIGVGAKAFVTQAGKLFDAGTFLLITSDADPTRFMAGQVASYVGTALTVNVNQSQGAGSFADWTIQVSGKFGVDGAQNPREIVIVTADLDISDGFTHNTFFQVRPVAEALVTITIPDATTAGFIEGYEGTFHLDLEGSVLVNTPSDPPVTEIDGASDLVISDPGSAVTLIASTATADWQISQDDRPKEAFGITLFPTTDADPIIAGYVAAVTDNDDVRYDDPSVTITTPVISNAALDRATAEEIFVFIADAGVVGDLLDNDLIITVVMNKTPSNARDVRVFSSFYVRDSGGTEVLIKETATSGLIDGSPLEQNLIFSNVTADIGITDRVVIKSFGFKNTSGGTNPAIEAPLGGKLPSDTPARLKIPQSLTSVSHSATTGLQGGGPGEFYHFTKSQYEGVRLNIREFGALDEGVGGAENTAPILAAFAAAGGKAATIEIPDTELGYYYTGELLIPRWISFSGSGVYGKPNLVTDTVDAGLVMQFASQLEGISVQCTTGLFTGKMVRIGDGVFPTNVFGGVRLNKVVLLNNENTSVASGGVGLSMEPDYSPSSFPVTFTRGNDVKIHGFGAGIKLVPDVDNWVNANQIDNLNFWNNDQCIVADRSSGGDVVGNIFRGEVQRAKITESLPAFEIDGDANTIDVMVFDWPDAATAPWLHVKPGSKGNRFPRAAKPKQIKDEGEGTIFNGSNNISLPVGSMPILPSGRRITGINYENSDLVGAARKFTVTFTTAPATNADGMFTRRELDPTTWAAFTGDIDIDIDLSGHPDYSAVGSRCHGLGIIGDTMPEKVTIFVKMQGSGSFTEVEVLDYSTNHAVYLDADSLSPIEAIRFRLNNSVSAPVSITHMFARLEAGTQGDSVPSSGGVIYGDLHVEGAITSDDPAFLARNSVTDSSVTGAGTPYPVICDSEVYDQTSDYDAGTGIYTASVAGVHNFTACIQLQSVTAAADKAEIRIKTSNFNFARRHDNINLIATNIITLFHHVECFMDVGDTAFPEIEITGEAGDTVNVVGDSAGTTFFSGSLKK